MLKEFSRHRDSSSCRYIIVMCLQALVLTSTCSIFEDAAAPQAVMTHAYPLSLLAYSPNTDLIFAGSG